MSVHTGTRSRTLLLLAKRPRVDTPRRIAAGDEPRAEYLELARHLAAEILDYHAVDASPSPAVRLIQRRLGDKWALAWMAFERRHAFDDLYVTGEDVGIPLATLLRLARDFERMTVVVHGAGTPKRRLMLRLLGSRVFRHIICLGAAQQALLTEEIGLAGAKVKRLDYWCDQRFFQPAGRAGAGAYLMSAGMENRDYATLQAALAGVPYPARIVASGWSPEAGFTQIGGVTASQTIEVVNNISFHELRELYAGARFVVVPLRHSNYSAGVTTIVEAMAMGKAVIASASPGILDYVRDGVSGTLVPVGDAAAMRAAISELWDDPQRAAAIGRRNRAWIEESINTDHYVAQIATLLSAAPAGPAPRVPAIAQ